MPAAKEQTVLVSLIAGASRVFSQPEGAEGEGGKEAKAVPGCIPPPVKYLPEQAGM